MMVWSAICFFVKSKRINGAKTLHEIEASKPRKKLHKTMAINNWNTYLEYGKTQFKYYIMQLYTIVAHFYGYIDYDVSKYESSFVLIENYVLKMLNMSSSYGFLLA